MKLYQYDDIRKLNQAVGSFNRMGVPVAKVEVHSVENKLQFFVLTDPKEDYLPKIKVESKTEEEVKKTLLAKKEVKKEEKVKAAAVVAEKQTKTVASAKV